MPHNTTCRYIGGATVLALLAPLAATAQERDQPVQGPVAPIPQISPTPTAQQPERLPGIPAIDFSLDGKKSQPVEIAPPEKAADAPPRPDVATSPAPQARPVPRTNEVAGSAISPREQTRAAPEAALPSAPVNAPGDVFADIPDPSGVNAPDAATPDASGIADAQNDSTGSSNAVFAFLFGAILLAGAFGLAMWRRRAKPASAARVEETSVEPQRPVAQPLVADTERPAPEPALIPPAMDEHVPAPARPVTTIASSLPAAPGAPVFGKTGDARKAEAPATRSGIPLPSPALSNQPPPSALPRFDKFGRPIAGAPHPSAPSRPAPPQPKPATQPPRKGGLVRYDMMGRPIID